MSQTNGGSWSVELTEDYFTLLDYAGEDRKECCYVYKTAAMRKDDGEEYADVACIVVTIDDKRYYLYRNLSENVSFYNKDYGLTMDGYSKVIDDLLKNY